MNPPTDFPNSPTDENGQPIAEPPPEFPSAIIAPPGLLIPDDARYGDEHLKPQFVVDDDQNFGGGL